MAKGKQLYVYAACAPSDFSKRLTRLRNVAQMFMKLNTTYVYFTDIKWHAIPTEHHMRRTLRIGIPLF